MYVIPLDALKRPERATALVATAVEGLAAEDLDTVGSDELNDDLVAIRRLIDLQEAEFCRRLRRFDRDEGFAADGSSSSVAWLRAACRLSGSAAFERVQVARQLAELPGTEASLRSGEIGYQHAAVIARSAAEIGTDEVKRAEATLLEASGRMDPGALRVVTRHMRFSVDPEGARTNEATQHERRRLQVSQTLDGTFIVDGLLDPEGGAIVQTALRAMAGAPRPGEDRRPEQRRADALVEMAARHLQGGLRDAHGQRPHLTMTATVGNLRGDASAPHAEILGAGPVGPHTARRLACDASMRAITVDERGQPLAVGRSSRTISPAIRAALVHRDKTCRFPDCDRPAEWTDAHHIKHWVDGGETTLANLALMCRPHHRKVHEEGWQLSRGADGSLLVKPPP